MRSEPWRIHLVRPTRPVLCICNRRLRGVILLGTETGVQQARGPAVPASTGVASPGTVDGQYATGGCPTSGLRSSRQRTPQSGTGSRDSAPARTAELESIARPSASTRWRVTSWRSHLCVMRSASSAERKSRSRFMATMCFTTPPSPASEAGYPRGAKPVASMRSLLPRGTRESHEGSGT